MTKSDMEVSLEELLQDRNAVTTAWLRQKLSHRGWVTVADRQLARTLTGMGFDFFRVMRVNGVAQRVYVRSSAGLVELPKVHEALRWSYEIAENEP